MINNFKVSNLLNNFPLMFQQNIGQENERIKFLLRENRFTTFFTQNEIVLSFNKLIKDKNNTQSKSMSRQNLKNNNEKRYDISIVRISLEGSNRVPTIIGEDKINYSINYFKGNKENWVTDVPVYQKVVYKEIYKNIDLAFYGNKGNLEYAFIVESQEDINYIKMNFEGADKIEIDENNHLVINIQNQIFSILRPKIYQEIDGDNREIENECIIEKNKVSFKVNKDFKSKILSINPSVLYGTYIGGVFYEGGYGVAVDENGIAYVTGSTESINFPVTGSGYQGGLKGGADGFLIKIDTKLSGVASLLYGTYIGGNGIDYGHGIAVDENEIVYITGETKSSNFPVTSSAYQNTLKGTSDVFLVKIDTKLSGVSSLLYGTYIGGNGIDGGNGIAIDKNGIAYITGYTNSNNFPVTTSAYQNTLKGTSDVFLVKLDTKLNGVSSLLYGTYIGGNGNDWSNGIAIDENEIAYITGETRSSNFPITTSAYQNTLKGTSDVFLVKLDTKSSGISGLMYGTYLGGGYNDLGAGITLDKNKIVYITGHTESSGFPVTSNGYQPVAQGFYDAFLVKIDTNLSGANSLLYGTFLGGSGNDYGQGVAVDEKENAYITGYTGSRNFPITENAYKHTLIDYKDAFLVKIDTKLSGVSSLIYGTYLGGNGDDNAYSIAIDEKENAYITGSTVSIDFPVTENAYQINKNNGYDAFLIKMNTRIVSSDLILKKRVYKCEECLENNIPYVIEVINVGPDEATDIIVTDIIQMGLVINFLDSDMGIIEKVGNTVTWKIEKLEVGQKGVAVIDVTITNVLLYKRNENVINTAILTADVNLVNPENSTDTVITCIKNKRGKTIVTHRF